MQGQERDLVVACYAGLDMRRERGGYRPVCIPASGGFRGIQCIRCPVSSRTLPSAAVANAAQPTAALAAPALAAPALATTADPWRRVL